MVDYDLLTVTKRTGWEVGARASIRAQTQQPNKWIVISEQNVNIPEAEVYPAPEKKYHTTLNASWNEGLRHCTSKYVIMYQDFIELYSEDLEKLVRSAEKTGGFVTTATINPDGKHDQRYRGTDDLHECPPPEWEANVAIAPLEALEQLGGFPEEYDRGWSWDNVNVAERAAMLGYKFYIDEQVKPRLLFHVKEPDADPTLELNAIRHEVEMANIRAGKKPIKYPYL